MPSAEQNIHQRETREFSEVFLKISKRCKAYTLRSHQHSHKFQLNSKNMILNLFILTLVLFNQVVRSSSCPTDWPMGYYRPCSGCSTATYTSGIPPATPMYKFALKPPALTKCEVDEIQRLCVDRINMYRAGELVFSDGTQDPALGNPTPLAYIRDMDKCHSGKCGGFFLDET
jgi:hypothetical protein